MNAKFRRLTYLLAPSAAALILALLVAFVMGGPIAGAIAGFVFGSAWLLNSVFVLLLLKISSTDSPIYQLLLGGGSYLVSMVLVVALWSMFGQSQIM